MHDPKRRAENAPYLRPERYPAHDRRVLPAAEHGAGRLDDVRREERAHPPAQQQARRVRRDLHAGAYFGELGALLENGDGVAAQAEGEGGGEAADAGADDEDGEGEFRLGGLGGGGGGGAEEFEDAGWVGCFLGSRVNWTRPCWEGGGSGRTRGPSCKMWLALSTRPALDLCRKELLGAAIVYD